MRRDHYETLELPPGAGPEAIRAAYRRLAKRYHPDASGQGGAEGHRRLAEVVDAYKALLSSTAAPSVMELGSRLMRDRDPRARVRAARLLGKAGRKAALMYLRHGLSDPEESVVVASVHACGRIGPTELVPQLRRLLDHKSVFVRRAVIDTIRESNNPTAFADVIRAGLKDDDKEVKRTSLRLYIELTRRGFDRGFTRSKEQQDGKDKT